MDVLRGIARTLRPPSPTSFIEGAKSILYPHYIVNILLAVSYFALKTTPYICEKLFENCVLELKELEWVTFLGCIIVLKNRKQASVSQYIETACLFGKALGLVMYFQHSVPMTICYCTACLLHFVFLPQPMYKGPEFVTYFRGPHLKTEIQRDKRITWLVCFYAAWSPACVSVAPMFAEISAEYKLDNFQFGKLDVSKFAKISEEEYRISTSSFSKQLPTIVLFQDGKEKMRRPAMSAKGTVVKYAFTKENIIRDFELNEVYNQCKKTLPKKSKNKEEKEKTE